MNDLEPHALLDPFALLDLALTVSRPVAHGLVQRRENGLQIETKSSATDLVTDADRWSEEQLVDQLLAARPDDGILGEEGSSLPGTSGVRWIIDPIDGTTNFVHDLPGYAVSIAAEIDGVISVGVVHDPIRAETFTAVRGHGSQRNGRPLRVSQTPDLGTALVGTGFSYRTDIRHHQAAVLARLLPDIRDIRRFGGAALDLCSVACGRLDAFYEIGLSPWDVAAGGLVALEAGAILTDFAGDEAWSDQTLCAPPALHAPLLNYMAN